jgi:hypothetical protein
MLVRALRLGISISMNQPRTTLNLGRTLSLTVIALLMISGCDKNQIASLDSKNSVPIVSDLRFSPDSVYIDNLTPVNGQYTITAMVRAAATDIDGSSDLAAVTVDVLRSNGALAIGSVALRDDGVLPDSVRADGIFSGSVSFSLTRAQSGRYQIRASASDRQGAVSNSLAGQLKLARRNSAPTVFNLDAPDSVTRPVSGNLLFTMSIAAADSDGLADVSEVYFRSLTSSTPDAKIFLYDDGGIVPHNGVTSGDPFAGDGLFSVIVRLPFDAAAGTRIFAFQANDTFHDTSATLIHPLVVR